MLNNDNKNVLKGQDILAQGKRSVALGWNMGLRSSARKGWFNRVSYFRRNGSPLFLWYLMLFNSIRRKSFALFNIFVRTVFVVSPITQSIVSVRSSRNYTLGYYILALQAVKNKLASAENII
jgi:hypothetical protein